MKFTFITICFLLFSKQSYSQSENIDSLYLYKTLVPFREHLNIVAQDINATYLFNEFQPPKIEKLPFLKPANETKPTNDYKPFIMHLPPPKVSFNEIIRNDTNHKIFIETEYDLRNRAGLVQLKSEFTKARKPEKKANILINYINALDDTYPSEIKWRFSQSYTFKKYFESINKYIAQTKSDTTKASCLINRAIVLMTIDPVFFKTTAFQDLLLAEKYLIQPYFDELRKNKVTNDSTGKYYRKFVEKSPNAITLAKVYGYLSAVLTPKSFANSNNELFPILNKAITYLRSTLRILKILKVKNKKYKDEFEIVQKSVLNFYTNIQYKKDSKYIFIILNDKINLLNYLIKDVLKVNDDSLSTVSKENMYAALGEIFESTNEYNYALKAYYKALQINFSKDTIFMDQETESLFSHIFFNLQRLPARDTLEVCKIQALYSAYISNRDIANKGHQYSFNFLYSNETYNSIANLYVLSGIADSARVFLNRDRKRYIYDSTLGKDEKETILATIYRNLYINNWLPPKPRFSKDLVDKMDSLFYEIYCGRFETNYEGDVFIPELVSNFDRSESNVTWRYEQEKLSKKIEASKRELLALNIRERKLIIREEILNDSIAEKNKTLSFMAIQMNNLERQNSKLGNSIAQKKDEVYLLQRNYNEIKNQRKLLYLSSILLTFLVLGLFITGLFIRKRNKTLNKINANLDVEILNKEREAEEKDYGKQLAEQQLLNDTALGHDLIELVNHIPYFIKKAIKTLPETLQSSDAFIQCQKFAEGVRKYFESNFNLKEKLVNTVKNDLQLAQEYCTLLQIIYHNDSRANLNTVSILPEILAIEIPKHNLVNFISNAFRHGRDKQENVQINVEGYKTEKGYIIAIRDNGGGFETINLEEKEDTRGIKLVLRQVDNYNSIKDNRYKILFSENNIENIFDKEERYGTRITYKIIAK